MKSFGLIGGGVTACEVVETSSYAPDNLDDALVESVDSAAEFPVDELVVVVFV